MMHARVRRISSPGCFKSELRGEEESIPCGEAVWFEALNSGYVLP